MVIQQKNFQDSFYSTTFLFDKFNLLVNYFHFHFNGKGSFKNNLDYFWVWNPPPKSNHLFFWQLEQFLSIFFPLKCPKHLKNWCWTCKMSCTLLQMLVILNTNDGWTMQNDGHTTRNVYQGPKGGLEEPPRAPGDPPTPILEKNLVSRNNF